MASFIEKRVAKVCIEMVRADVIDKREYFIYKYNLILVIERTITMIPIITVSIVMRRIIEMIVFLFSFALLRKYTGGYHCKSFIGCFVMSNISCLATIPIAALMENNYTVFLILDVLSATIVLCLGSLNNQYIDWNQDELSKAKRLSKIFCLIILILSLILGVFNFLRIYSIYMGIGLIQTSFAMLLYKIHKKGGYGYETK